MDGPKGRIWKVVPWEIFISAEPYAIVDGEQRLIHAALGPNFTRMKMENICIASEWAIITGH